MSQKNTVYDRLSKQQISYRTAEHEAVFTIDEMRGLDFPEETKVAKNLFLRDAKGKRHFLITLEPDTRADLKLLAEKFSSTKLSFASDERLLKYLGLYKGAVSPFGLINDGDNQVEFYIDKKLSHCKSLGVHPNDNRATVFLDCDCLVKFIESTGHKVHFFSLD